MLAGHGPRPAGGGPTSWPRSASSPRLGLALPHTRVSQVSRTRTTISIDVSRIGVPGVIKASYFPWWHVAGAQGPWRIAPNAMDVVPTTPHVVASVGPRTIDAVARGISIDAIVGAVALLLVDRRRRNAAMTSAR